VIFSSVCFLVRCLFASVTVLARCCAARSARSATSRAKTTCAALARSDRTRSPQALHRLTRGGSGAVNADGGTGRMVPCTCAERAPKAKPDVGLRWGPVYKCMRIARGYRIYRGGRDERLKAGPARPISLL
jgi:hypothetical protein